MGLLDYKMDGTQPVGRIQDWIKQAKAGVSERVGLLKQDPKAYLLQAAMEGLPPMPDIGQNPDGTIRRNPDDPATKWLADNVGFGALTVYHGSPHKFGKFDMSKIGTGEGAQAYGHGVYTAESPNVAKGYQKTLSSETFLTPDGAVWSPDNLRHLNVKVVARKGGTDLRPALDKAMAMYADAPEATKGLLKADIDELQGLLAKGGITENTGQFYKADIPDDQIANMIDWDAPLSGQSDYVKQALSRAGLVDFEKNIGPSPAGDIRDLGWTSKVGSLKGEDLHKRLVENQLSGMGVDAVMANAKSKAQKGVAERLTKEGIRGIRYFDEGSRASGEGTRNFVLFDDQLPRILERNGVPTGQQPWAPGEYELLRRAQQ